MPLADFRLGRWLAPLVLVGLTACASQAAETGYANPQMLTETSELEVMLGSRPFNLIDVRPRAAYDEGHIPGAVHLGADDVIDSDSHIEGTLLSAEQLTSMLGARGVDKDDTIVLYDDRGGFHASRLFWMLEHFGHQRVSILNGGFPKWKSEGRQVTTTVPDMTPTTFAYTPVPRRLATADWLLDRRYDSNVSVIDVRPTRLYQESHIPWAQSIPWAQNLREDGTMKPADELLRHFASHGITPDRNIAVHCQNGKAAAHTYFTLRLLGYPRVRSYDRSWAEWGTADELPKTIATGG